MSDTNIHLFETVIRTQLKSLGYNNIDIKNEQGKRFDVIADGTLRQIFLRVLIKLVSDHFSGFTKEEITTIKLEAQSVHKEPWTAVMSVNEQGALVDKVVWKNLSKEIA